MSTPNFKNENASKVFSSECKNDFDYDDLISNVRSELKDYTDAETFDNDRSYPGRVFAERDINFSTKWIIEIQLIIRSGYYGGMNLDWEIWARDCNEDDKIDYANDGESLPKSLRTRIQAEIKKIEKVYAVNTPPLICLGVFSNGEAVYKKA